MWKVPLLQSQFDQSNPFRITLQSEVSSWILKKIFLFKTYFGPLIGQRRGLLTFLISAFDFSILTLHAEEHLHPSWLIRNPNRIKSTRAISTIWSRKTSTKKNASQALVKAVHPTQRSAQSPDHSLRSRFSWGGNLFFWGGGKWPGCLGNVSKIWVSIWKYWFPLVGCLVGWLVGWSVGWLDRKLVGFQ